MRIASLGLRFERQLLNLVNQSNRAAAVSALRLATSHKINTPSDDPSAFVALSRFQSQLSAVNAAISNASAADSTISQIELTLTQIRDQIDIIRDAALADQGGGLSDEERAVKQAEIDEAISAINQLAGTKINGRQLLNAATVRVVGVDDTTEVSDTDPDQVASVEVESIDANVAVTLTGSVTAATQAELTYVGGAGGVVTATAPVTITGDVGTAEIVMTEGESLVAVRDRINELTEVTGVAASLEGEDLVFQSASAGADAHIEVEATDVEQVVDVTGVNASHFSGFQVDSMNPESTVTFPAESRRPRNRGSNDTRALRATSRTTPRLSSPAIWAARPSR